MTKREKIERELILDLNALFVEIEAYKALVELDRLPEVREAVLAHIDELIVQYEEKVKLLANARDFVARESADREEKEQEKNK